MLPTLNKVYNKLLYKLKYTLIKYNIELLDDKYILSLTDQNIAELSTHCCINNVKNIEDYVFEYLDKVDK